MFFAVEYTRDRDAKICALKAKDSATVKSNTLVNTDSDMQSSAKATGSSFLQVHSKQSAEITFGKTHAESEQFMGPSTPPVPTPLSFPVLAVTLVVGVAAAACRATCVPTASRVYSARVTRFSTH